MQPDGLPAVPLRSTRHVLVVDDEPHILADLQRWLGESGWSVTAVETSGDALRAVRSCRFSIAVVDWFLGAEFDGIRLGRVLHRRWGIPFLLISGYLTPPVVVEATRAGALDVIDKPLGQWRFLTIFERMASKVMNDGIRPARFSTTTANSVEAVPSELCAAPRRWARFVFGACKSAVDPRTTAIWARVVAVGASTIEATCDLCGVETHDSRDLGRFLWAIGSNRTGSVPLRDLFEVADKRTLERLFDRAGLARNARIVPLKDFLTRQTFIPTTKPCLHELTHLAANSPIFF